MPMYEYRCDDCQGVTELLRPMREADAAASCDACGSTRTRRVQSVFAACAPDTAPGTAPGSNPGPAGACCPCGQPGGACGMN